MSKIKQNAVLVLFFLYISAGHSQNTIEDPTTTKVKHQKNTIAQDTYESGYYVVTNAFAQPDNAVKWKQLLLEMGYEPQSFLNPENGLEYIYIAFDSSEFILRDVLKKVRDNPLLKETWIKQIE